MTARLDWRRPHPLTIVVEIGLMLRSVALIGVLIWSGRIGAGPDGGMISSVLEVGVVVSPLAGALARWYTTRYALDAEALHYHRGLIWRHKQVLPRANVQNVSTKAGLVARLGSVVELQVSDASSTGDITLRFVAQDEADRLTTLLRSTANAGSDTEAQPGTEAGLGAHPDARPAIGADAEAVGIGPASMLAFDVAPVEVAMPVGAPVAQRPMVAPSFAELLKAEATSMVVLVTIPMLIVTATVAPAVLLWLRRVGPDEVEVVRQARAWWAVAAVAAMPAVVAVSNVVARLFVVGGYQLTAEPDRLRIQAGLLTEARVSARRERIQQIRVLRQLPHQWLGIERVEFETADVEISNDSGATGYLSPAGPAGGWRRLAAEAVGEVQLDETDLQPVSPLTKRRVLVRFAAGSVPWLGLAVLHPALPIPLVAVTLAIGWWYSRRRFEVLGWAVSDDQILVRTGVVLGRLTLVRLDKVQSLGTTSTIFQRRLGLANLRLSTAGRGFQGLVAFPDLPLPVAEDLLDRLARRAAATPIAGTL